MFRLLKRAIRYGRTDRITLIIAIFAVKNDTEYKSTNIFASEN